MLTSGYTPLGYLHLVGAQKGHNSNGKNTQAGLFTAKIVAFSTKSSADQCFMNPVMLMCVCIYIYIFKNLCIWYIELCM